MQTQLMSVCASAEAGMKPRRASKASSNITAKLPVTPK